MTTTTTAPASWGSGTGKRCCTGPTRRGVGQGRDQAKHRPELGDRQLQAQLPVVSGVWEQLGELQVHPGLIDNTWETAHSTSGFHGFHTSSLGFWGPVPRPGDGWWDPHGEASPGGPQPALLCSCHPGEWEGSETFNNQPSPQRGYWHLKVTVQPWTRVFYSQEERLTLMSRFTLPHSFTESGKVSSSLYQLHGKQRSHIHVKGVTAECTFSISQGTVFLKRWKRRKKFKSLI